VEQRVDDDAQVLPDDQRCALCSSSFMMYCARASRTGAAVPREAPPAAIAIFVTKSRRAFVSRRPPSQRERIRPSSRRDEVLTLAEGLFFLQ
jgi:hypothetical protein